MTEIDCQNILISPSEQFGGIFICKLSPGPWEINIGTGKHEIKDMVVGRGSVKPPT